MLLVISSNLHVKTIYKDAFVCFPDAFWRCEASNRCDLLNTHCSCPRQLHAVAVRECCLRVSSHTCLFTLLPAARTGSPAGDSADRRHGQGFRRQDGGRGQPSPGFCDASGHSGDSSTPGVWRSTPAPASGNHGSGKHDFFSCSPNLRGHSCSLWLLVCGCPYCPLASPALSTPL